MLYQLSYSPNELDDLEAFFEGYTSAVRDEADVYPKRRNVARGQRKKASAAFFRCIRRPRSEPPCAHARPERYFALAGAAAAGAAFAAGGASARILVTTPAPTVLPPSRIANRRPSSHAIGDTSTTSTLMLSPGITISVPAGNVTVPVTSVVRK